MSIWVAYFLELWKRKEALLGHIWGTLKQTENADVSKIENSRTRKKEQAKQRVKLLCLNLHGS